MILPDTIVYHSIVILGASATTLQSVTIPSKIYNYILKKNWEGGGEGINNKSFMFCISLAHY